MGRATLRCTTLLAVCTLLALGGCSDSSSGGGGITSGTIGGLAFTVVDGTVTQDGDDGPITTGAEGAAIHFDDSLPALSGTSDEARFDIDATINDDGFVGAVAYGSTADEFDSSLIAGLRRSGNDYDWAMFWGIANSPADSGTLSPLVDNPDGTIRVHVGFDNNTSSAASIAVRHPDDAQDTVLNPVGCIGGDNPRALGTPEGVVDYGNGQRAGILFEDATVSDIVMDASASFLCG